MQPSDTVLVEHGTGHTIVMKDALTKCPPIYTKVNLNCFNTSFHFRLDQFNKRCSWRIKYGCTINRLIGVFLELLYSWNYQRHGIFFSSSFKNKNKFTGFHVDSYRKLLGQLSFCTQANT